MEQAAKEMSAAYLPSLNSFLKTCFQGWHNAHCAPDIPGQIEANARAACRIPDDDKILALVDDTLFGTGKNCVVFTQRGIYQKPTFLDPVLISYEKLLSCSYRRFKKMFPVEPYSPEKDMVVICQKVKTIVMYGNPDSRELPPDPDKDPHPVRSWLIFATTFTLFVLIVPGVLWVQWLVPAGYSHAGRVIGLISLLSWFIWFHSHQVSVKKNDNFTFATILKRVVFGGLAAASFAGAVLLDKFASSADGIKSMEIASLTLISLLCATLCIVLIFKAQNLIHNMRQGSRVKRVVARYMKNKRASGMAGLCGLLDAGVCELSDDADIRKVCRVVAGQSEHPLGQYQDMLAHVNLMAFFQHARDHGYDFSRHGKPDEIIIAISRRAPPVEKNNVAAWSNKTPAGDRLKAAPEK